MEIQLEKDAYSFDNNLYFIVLMNCETPKTQCLYIL